MRLVPLKSRFELIHDLDRNLDVDDFVNIIDGSSYGEWWALWQLLLTSREGRWHNVSTSSTLYICSSPHYTKATLHRNPDLKLCNCTRFKVWIMFNAFCFFSDDLIWNFLSRDWKRSDRFVLLLALFLQLGLWQLFLLIDCKWKGIWIGLCVMRVLFCFHLELQIRFVLGEIWVKQIIETTELCGRPSFLFFEVWDQIHVFINVRGCRRTCRLVNGERIGPIFVIAKGI